MVINPSYIPVLREADTGKYRSRILHTVERDEELVERARRRYGTRGLTEGRPPEDLIERARYYHDVARSVFKRDGFHHPFAEFLRLDGSGSLVSPVAFDKRDQFLTWHALARDAVYEGFTGVIFTGEAWTASGVGRVPPYANVKNLPGRKEFVVTFAEDASERSVILGSEIVRVLNKPFLKRTIEGDSFGIRSADMFSPLRRVWKATADEGEDAKSNTGAVTP